MPSLAPAATDRGAAGRAGGASNGEARGSQAADLQEVAAGAQGLFFGVLAQL